MNLDELRERLHDPYDWEMYALVLDYDAYAEQEHKRADRLQEAFNNFYRLQEALNGLYADPAVVRVQTAALKERAEQLQRERDEAVELLVIIRYETEPWSYMSMGLRQRVSTFIRSMAKGDRK